MAVAEFLNCGCCGMVCLANLPGDWLALHRNRRSMNDYIFIQPHLRVCGLQQRCRPLRASLLLRCSRGVKQRGCGVIRTRNLPDGQDSLLHASQSLSLRRRTGSSGKARRNNKKGSLRRLPLMVPGMGYSAPYRYPINARLCVRQPACGPEQRSSSFRAAERHREG